MPKQIKWPKWLLVEENPEPDEVSGLGMLNATSAAASVERGFRPMTDPAQAELTRALVIDRRILGKSPFQLSYAEALGLISLLADHDLELYLCCDESPQGTVFHKVDRQHPCPPSLIERLALFEPATDHDKLYEQQTVTFDASVYVDSAKWTTLLSETLRGVQWNGYQHRKKIEEDRKYAERHNIESSTDVKPEGMARLASERNLLAILRLMDEVEPGDGVEEQFSARVAELCSAEHASDTSRQLFEALSKQLSGDKPVWVYASLMQLRARLESVTRKYPIAVRAWCDGCLQLVEKNPSGLGVADRLKLVLRANPEVNARFSPVDVSDYQHLDAVSWFFWVLNGSSEVSERMLQHARKGVATYNDAIEIINTPLERLQSNQQEESTEYNNVAHFAKALLSASKKKQPNQGRGIIPAFLNASAVGAFLGREQLLTVWLSHSDEFTADNVKDLATILRSHPELIGKYCEVYQKQGTPDSEELLALRLVHRAKQLKATGEALSSRFSTADLKRILTNSNYLKLFTASEQWWLLEQLQQFPAASIEWSSFLDCNTGLVRSFREWAPVFLGRSLVDNPHRMQIFHLVQSVTLEEAEWFFSQYQSDLNWLFSLDDRLEKPIFSCPSDALSLKYLRDPVKAYVIPYKPETRCIMADERQVLVFASLTDQIRNKELPNLAALEIVDNDSVYGDEQHMEDFLQQLKANCPKLLQLTLPPRWRDIAARVGLTFQESRRVAFLDRVVADAELARGRAPVHEANTQPANPRQTLYVAQGKVGGVDLAPSANPTEYQMQQGGEIISADFTDTPCVRTRVFDVDFSTFERTVRQAECLTEIKPKSAWLEPDALKRHADSRHDQLVAKFRVRLQADRDVRLLSLTADEGLLAAKCSGQAGVTFYKGKDGFIYARATANVDLEYVIEAPKTSLLVDNTEALPEAIRRIVAEYKKPPYQAEATDRRLPPRAGKSNDQWLKEWFEQRSGVCGHRCLAVYHRILNDPACHAYRDRVRMLGVDNNHVRLEVLDDHGRWQQLDFGGGNVREVFKPGGDAIDLAANESASFAPKNDSRQAATMDTSASAQPAGMDTAAAAQRARIDNEIPEEEKKKIEQAVRNIFAVDALEEVSNQEDLLKKLPPATQPLRALVQSKHINQHMISVIKDAAGKGLEVFCINSPADLDVGDHFINLDDVKKPKLSPVGDLKAFLRRAKLADAPPARLMINWAAFNPQQRVALNTLLDPKPTIIGEPVPGNVQIVGLTDVAPTDSSFVSRHNAKVHADFFPSPTAVGVLDSAHRKTVDLEGFPNWQEQLLGQIICDHNQLHYHESDFVRQLQSASRQASEGQIAPQQLEVKNVPHKARPELRQLLRQAKARGYFLYHNRKIPVPAHVCFAVSDAEFDFSAFRNTGHQVVSDVIAPQLGADVHVVNTYLFDQLLARQSVAHSGADPKKGIYRRHEGLIAAAASAAPKVLKLQITSDLSDSQWYCLFAEAQKQQVRLALFLSPKVKLPAHCRLPVEAATNSAAMRHQRPVARRGSEIIVTNQVREMAAKRRAELLERQDEQSPLILDVEDYGYHDLVDKIALDKPQGEQFDSFRYLQSDVIKALANGRHVILKGEFSKAALSGLQPLLVDNSCCISNGQRLPLTGKLSLIVDSKQAHDFSWHDPALVKRPAAVPARPVQHFDPIVEPKPERWDSIPPDTAESVRRSDSFIKARVDRLEQAIQQPRPDGSMPSLMVQLIGDSGVGKSHLLDELERLRPNSTRVFHEMAGIAEWAKDEQDSEPGGQKKTRYLFIDENNLEKKHLTMFASLGRRDSNGRCEFVYEGTRYTLGPEHRVVFACNPRTKQFSGGRVAQKLFSEVAIPEIQCQDFPDSYIYERLLKPIYEASGLGRRVVNPIQEHIFRASCAAKLELYHRHQGLTVRELESWALGYCARQQALTHLKYMRLKAAERLQQGAARVASAAAAVPTQKDYVEISATLPARLALTTALKVSERRSASVTLKPGKDEAFDTTKREPLFPTSGKGLNAILIEGQPGLGKSEMVRYVLHQQGYKILPEDAEHSSPRGLIPPGDETPSINSSNVCYKIDASLPTDEKIALLCAAFDNGQRVWIDEINSCLHDGFEKYLNAALTGKHPLTKKAPQQPGFQLIATANSAGKEGRSVIGSAIRHRSVQIMLPLPDYDSLYELLSKVLPSEDLAKVNLEVMTDVLLQLMQRNENINLRSIRDKLSSLVGVFDREKIAQAALDTTTLENMARTTLGVESGVDEKSWGQRFVNWFDGLPGWGQAILGFFGVITVFPALYYWYHSGSSETDAAPAQAPITIGADEVSAQEMEVTSRRGDASHAPLLHAHGAVADKAPPSAVASSQAADVRDTRSGAGKGLRH